MNPKNALFAFFFLAGILTAETYAATNGVAAGGNVQAAIDAAAAGDTLLLEPGPYLDPFNFTKPLTVACTAPPTGAPASFMGKVTIQNSGSTLFQQCLFAGSVETVGASLTVIDSRFSSPILARGGKLTLKRTVLDGGAPLVLTNNAGLEALRLNAASTVTSYASPANPSQILAVQSSFGGAVTFNNGKLWLGYNTFGYGSGITFNSCDALLIGNKTYVGNGWAVSANGGTLRAYNNFFNGRASLGSGSASGISLSGTAFESVNNTIASYYEALFVRNAPAPINLRNTIVFSQNYSAINTDAASSSLIFANSCHFYGGNPQGYVLVPFVNCIVNSDPLVLSDGSVRDDSPCINAGMTPASYNNRDGTRNTIGYTGGPCLNPANYTNNAPMVFLLAGPQTLFKGAQSTINVSAAASAGH